MPTLLAFLLCFSTLSVFAQEASHTVFFQRDVFEVSDDEQMKLMDWLESQPDSVMKITVVGYADYLGSLGYNSTLSENRANSVMQLIENFQTTQYRMSLVSSIGEEKSIDTGSPDGVPADRKVVVTASLHPVNKEPERIKTQDANQVSLATELLEKAEIGQSIVFGNLNFFPGRHYLVPAALPELESLVESLKENSNIEIEIIGHICCKLDSIDGLDVNTRTYTLSANRAKYIHDQLVLAGINEERLSHRGMAGSRPLVVPELTDKDRARNRRVEIKVTGK